ncbi:hypothetical protein OU426_08240 [Frigidibacter sp. RF13]|uniref:hypothetical protein n=1 Tax=Frigidibacter sp. RF13 TaxID=2997340 RepID=UPI0022708FEA|nr:hypothetical protein [Frigidibacter sp. RF13]MCY1126839.1 hypothetical protein [Frigidibacter sp. RF13]
MFGMEGNRVFGRKILVTAAATPFGRAVALCLAARGADVLAIDVDRARLDDLAWDSAGSVATRLGDAASPGDAFEIAAWLRSDHVNLSGLIACPAPLGKSLSAELAPRLARLLRANVGPFAVLVTGPSTDRSAAAESLAPFRARAVPTIHALAPEDRTQADSSRMAARLLDGLDRGRSTLRLSGRSRASSRPFLRAFSRAEI